MARKASLDSMVANLNARIRAYRAQGKDTHQLQDFLDAICRHQAGVEEIETDTAALINVASYYETREMKA